MKEIIEDIKKRFGCDAYYVKDFGKTYCIETTYRGNEIRFEIKDIALYIIDIRSGNDIFSYPTVSLYNRLNFIDQRLDIKYPSDYIPSHKDLNGRQETNGYLQSSTTPKISYDEIFTTLNNETVTNTDSNNTTCINIKYDGAEENKMGKDLIGKTVTDSNGVEWLIYDIRPDITPLWNENIVIVSLCNDICNKSITIFKTNLNLEYIPSYI